MAHKWWPVPDKNVQRFVIAQMTHASRYSFFKIERVISFVQHVFVIVRLQESCMALFEIMDHIFTRFTDIRKYPYRYFVTLHYKTVRICRIMKFRKSYYRQIADKYRLVRYENFYQRLLKRQPTVLHGGFSDINR